ncbi:alpha-hydroxy-acid oxidizing protein [Kitasatospora sp. NPDC036755]|uniref:alpha-hydroxy-acid oxidizing protein n=1 Tax=Kitasatospora sp. NPDC036755 TaxID=3154600 RepID=UPI0033F48CAD
MRDAVCLSDLERLAEQTLSPQVWDFAAGGAGYERTLAANREALDAVRLAPRTLHETSHCDPAPRILGWNPMRRFYQATVAAPPDPTISQPVGPQTDRRRHQAARRLRRRPPTTLRAKPPAGSGRPTGKELR